MIRKHMNRMLATMLAAAFMLTNVPTAALAAPAGTTRISAPDAATQPTSGETPDTEINWEEISEAVPPSGEAPDTEEASGETPETEESSPETPETEEASGSSPETEETTVETPSRENQTEEDSLSGNGVIPENKITKLPQKASTETGSFNIKLNSDTDEAVVGKELLVDTASLPETLLTGEISLSWYRQGNVGAVATITGTADNASLSTVLSGLNSSYETKLEDSGKIIFAKITCSSNSITVLEYISNSITPVLALEGNAKAGGGITGSRFYQVPAVTMYFYKWYQVDGGTGVRKEVKSGTIPLSAGNSLSSILYYPKDGDIGKKFCLSISQNNGVNYYDSELSDAVAPSDYQEIFEWTDPQAEINAGKLITGDFLKCSLEKFRDGSGSSNISVTYTLKLMASTDRSAATPTDDTQLWSKSETASVLASPNFSLPTHAAGKYLYFQLECQDEQFRKPLYQTSVTGPVTDYKFPLSTDPVTIGSYLRSNSIPAECISKGAYTYRFLRTTGLAGAEPESVHTGKSSSSSLVSLHMISEADIGNYFYIELIAADGTKYYSEKSTKINPRTSLSLSGSTRVGGTLYPTAFSNEIYLDQGIQVSYEYYTAESSTALSGQTVQTGSLLLESRDMLSNLFSYRLQHGDLGKYVHLKLIIGRNGKNHTYYLAADAPVTSRQTQFSVRAEKTEGPLAIGDRIAIDLGSLPEANGLAPDSMKIEWYQEGKELPLTASPKAFIVDPFSFQWSTAAAMTDLKDYFRYQTDLFDGGSPVYCLITLYNGSGAEIEVFESTILTPGIPLYGTAKAGSPLSGGPDYKITAPIEFDYKWFRTDEKTGLKTEIESSSMSLPAGSDLSSLKYYLKDNEVGSKLSFAVSKSKGKWCNSSLSAAVIASGYSESFHWTDVTAERNVGDRVGSGLLSCNLENFGSEPGSLAGERSYQVTLIASGDQSVITPEDDMTLYSVEKTGNHLSPDIQYTLTGNAMGKYLYFRLEGGDFRRAVYTTEVSSAVGMFKFQLSSYNQRIGSYLSTSDIPRECYSQGSYAYKILRTSTVPGATNVTAEKGSGSGATLNNYMITDADIGCYLTMEITAADGTIYTSKNSTIIEPRHLSLAGEAMAGKEISIAAGSFDDQYIRKSTEIAYEYYVTTDPSGTKGAVVSSGSVDAKDVSLYAAVPSYTLKDVDAGKYLHLKLTLSVSQGSYTYLLDLKDSIASRNIQIAGNPEEGSEISVTLNGAILHSTQSRYEWLRKSEGDISNENADGDTIASGRTSAASDGSVSIPAYSLQAADANKYIFLRITDGSHVWYSQNAIGPVLPCELMTGKVTISGEPVTGTTLKADWNGKTKENGYSFQWFQAYDQRCIGTGSEYTLVEADAGKQIYVKATGDGSKYRGSLSSARTSTVLSQYSPEHTGIKAIQATVQNETLGYNSDGTREAVKLSVTLYGVTTLPKGFSFGTWVNDVQTSPDHQQITNEVPGNESVDYEITIQNPPLKGGTNPIVIKVGEYGSYVQGISAKVLTEAYEDIPIALFNAMSSNQLQVVKGESTSLYVTAGCPSTYTYQVNEGAVGITVSDGGVIKAENYASGTALITITAVSRENTRLRGKLTVAVEVVNTAVPVTGIQLALQGDSSDTGIKTALGKLSTGFDKDPRQSGEPYRDSLQLGYRTTPADATANYTPVWKSSDTTAVTVDQNGLVTVLAQGKTVTITVSAGALSDAVTFTTATTKYEPQEIIYQPKALALSEQSYLQINNVKVKCRVNGGKTTRTFQLNKEAFSYTVSDPAIATADNTGALFGAAPGETTLTLKLGSTNLTKTVPVTVKEKKYAAVHFTLNGHYISTTADKKGNLLGDVLLYQGLDVPNATSFPFSGAMGYVASEQQDFISRDIDLSGISLKLKAGYKANKAVKYTLTLPNKQKMILTVTIADTQPVFVSGATLYSGLDVETPVTFSIYPGTKIYSANVSDDSKVTATSWSQDSNTVTVWVKCKGSVKSGKLPTTFLFETADFGTQESTLKTASVKLTAAAIPSASMVPIYATGKAFSKSGYTLKNMGELMKISDKYHYDTGSDGEWMETVKQYTSGYYTVYPDQILSTSNNAYAGLLEIKEGQLILREGKDPNSIPDGSPVFTLKYYYMSEGSMLKTQQKDTSLTVHFKSFGVAPDKLTYHMIPSLPDSSGEYAAESLDFKLYSHYKGDYALNKTDLKKYGSSALDQRYAMGTGDSYALYWAKNGQLVKGVTIAADSEVYRDSVKGQYKLLTLSIAANSELMEKVGESGLRSFPKDSFEIRMKSSNAYAPAVKITFPAEIAITTDRPTVTPAKNITAFNQTAFSQQKLVIPYSATADNFSPYRIETIMTKSPQMEDPFTFRVTPYEMTVLGNSQTAKTPQPGTYTYACKLLDAQGLYSNEFLLNLKVTKAAGNMVIKAKVSGSLNPFYYNKDTGEGGATITFSSNIPNMDIDVLDMKLLETPKGFSGAVETSTDLIAMGYVQKNILETKNVLRLSPSREYYYKPDYSYIPADIKVSAGNGYTAVFKLLSPVSIKTTQKNKVYSSGEWDLSRGGTKREITLSQPEGGTGFMNLSPAIAPLDRLPDGTMLYKKVDKEYIKVEAAQIAPIESIKLKGAAAKNFTITGYAPDGSLLTLEAQNDSVLKAGTQKLTYEIVPSSSSAYSKQKVYDLDGNQLYLMTEDFNGIEKYTAASVETAKPVSMQQSIYFYYGKVNNPSKN